MAARFSIVCGSIFTVVLMVTAMWTWQQGPHWAIDAERPEIYLWAVRSAAIAGVGLAQTILLWFVVGAVYRTRMIDIALRIFTGSIFLVALIAAVVLEIQSTRL